MLHPFAEFREERRWVTLFAFLAALLLHVGVVAVLPEEILGQRNPDGRETSQQLEVEFLPPEAIDPEDLRFVEANPEAPENEPDRQDQYSYRSQQAADENPDEALLDAPSVDGEEDSQKIMEGALEQAEPLPPGVYSPAARPGEGEGTEGGTAGAQTDPALARAQPVPPPAFLEQEPVEEDGPGSGDATEALPDPDPEAPIDVYRPQPSPESAQTRPGDGSGGVPEAKPTPRERPRLAPELIQGPLMRSLGSASRRGSVAIDATFSEFGEYQQQFYAAIQAGWYQEIEFFQPIDTATRVHIRFTLRSDGTIHDLKTLDTTASEVATVICETAISKRSPFRPWTREMVKVFGEERTLNVVFHYR